MEDLSIYSEFRARGETSPLLRVAEYWLRSELKKRMKVALASGVNMDDEAADGAAAIASKDPLQTSYNSGGGFAPGRMGSYDFIGVK